MSGDCRQIQAWPAPLGTPRIAALEPSFSFRYAWFRFRLGADDENDCWLERGSKIPNTLAFQPGETPQTPLTAPILSRLGRENLPYLPSSQAVGISQGRDSV